MIRFLAPTLLIATCVSAYAQISPDNAIRVSEFYRLADRIQNQIWLNWSSAPKGLVLVTPETEFLTHYSHPPSDFHSVGGGYFARKRTFDPNIQATFPAFGSEAVIVIGAPKGGEKSTSTPWLFTVMHEHFHQLQDAQRGYYDDVNNIGLSHADKNNGDKTGMWMLNYPFPYGRADVKLSFIELRDALFRALNAPSGPQLKATAAQYVDTRRRFFAQVSADDAKYLEFQLWQEGIARYTEIQAALEAAKYQPSAKFAALPDYTPISAYGAKLKQATLDELQHADIGELKRGVVYSLGAAEGMLLDRISLGWKNDYFSKPFTLEPHFANPTN